MLRHTVPVSYTHLDVYKRQDDDGSKDKAISLEGLWSHIEYVFHPEADLIVSEEYDVQNFQAISNKKKTKKRTKKDVYARIVCVNKRILM